MQYKFGIVDDLSTLSELDRRQIEEIAWSRLASIEHRVRAVYFRMTPELNKDFQCQYRAEWVLELASGRVVTTRLSQPSIGAAVVCSAEQMSEMVQHRLAFENTWAFRTCTNVKRTFSRFTLDRERTSKANCPQTMA